MPSESSSLPASRRGDYDRAVPEEERDMSAEEARSDVLLVGSLPYDTAEEAIRAAATGLRGHVGWVPDGEVGERINWVGMLPLVVFPQNPDLEETMAPPEHQLEQPEHEEGAAPVEDLEGLWSWRI